MKTTIIGMPRYIGERHLAAMFNRKPRTRTPRLDKARAKIRKLEKGLRK